MVLDGALKMLAAQAHPAAKSMVEMSITESRHRIEFLESELKKLNIKRSSVAPTPTGNLNDANSPMRSSTTEPLSSSFGIKYLISFTTIRKQHNDRKSQISLKRNIRKARYRIQS